MQKLIAYPLSVIYYLLFGFTLVFFHLVQWLCFNLFGYEAHKRSADLFCYSLVVNTYVLGTRYRVRNIDKLPTGSPLIIVANHQSFYDIPAISWFFRRVHPKYVSKIELGKGIPSISYNLRHGGSVLINRKDPKQALSAIRLMSEYIEATKRSVVIFPEGTRSKTGTPGPFAESGLKVLCKYAPSAYVVPVTINNSWRVTRWGVFPMGVGSRVELIIHDPISVQETPFPELFARTEQEITQAIR